MINYQTLDTNEEKSFDDEKLSCASIASIQSNDSNHVILNPDGSLMNGTLAIRYKAKIEEENNIQTNQNNHQVVYIVDDDEIIFYAGINEIPMYFDDLVSVFIKNIRYFILLLITFFLFETFYGIYAYFHQEETLHKLEKFYPSLTRASLLSVLHWATIVESVFVVIYYFVGLLASLRRSTRLLGCFTGLSLVGLIIQMLLAYIDKFNLVVFLWRFAALVYSRFLTQILISVLLIPRVTQGHITTTSNRA